MPTALGQKWDLVKQVLKKRLLPLASLGIVLALMASLMIKAIPKEVSITILINNTFINNSKQIDLLVIADETEELASRLIFRLEGLTEKPQVRFKHVLRLLAGEYTFLFHIVESPTEKIREIRRHVTVSSDDALTIHLP